MMLRILRTNFRWETPPGHEVRFGGQNPVVLRYDEKLQYGVDYGNTLPPTWYDVPIVEEGEKPEHPHDRQDRIRRERFAAYMESQRPKVQEQMQEAVDKAKEEKK
jgi:hypothetical protein